MGMDFMVSLVSTDLIEGFTLSSASCSQTVSLVISHHCISSVCSFPNLQFLLSIIMNNDNGNGANGAGAPAPARDNRNLVIGALRGHSRRRRKNLSVLERGEAMFMECTRRVNHGGDYAAAARVQHARDVCCCCRRFCRLDFTRKHAVLDRFLSLLRRSDVLIFHGGAVAQVAAAGPP